MSHAMTESSLNIANSWPHAGYLGWWGGGVVVGRWCGGGGGGVVPGWWVSGEVVRWWGGGVVLIPYNNYVRVVACVPHEAAH